MKPCTSDKMPDSGLGKSPSDQWIVFFGEDWGRHNSTGQYLATSLAKHYRLVWVNSIGLRAPKLSVSDFRRVVGKFMQFSASLVRRRQFEPGQEKNHGIVVATPLALPLLRYRWVRWLNRRLVRRYLSKILEEHHVERPVVITACPATVDVLDDIPASIKVYYCADEHSELPGMDRQLVQALEAELLSKMDMVIATSKELVIRKSQMHNAVHYLPHGVNFQHLSRAAISSWKIPEDIKLLSGPLVGYIGLIGEHLDFNLLEYTAEQLPDVSVVMIGPIQDGISSLPRKKNILYLGQKPYSELPGYLAAFDVCLLPWNQGERNRYANPTKLREYLAAGCPVVSSPHAEISGVSDDVYVGLGPDGFVSEIRRLLRDGAKHSRVELSRTMKAHDWQLRAEQALDLIAAHATAANHEKRNDGR